MLGRYLLINGVEFPNPVSFSENPQNMETVNMSEVSTELISVNRLLKYACTMSFQMSSFWKSKLVNECAKPIVKIKVDGVEHTGRLRLTGSTLAKNSEYSSETQGYWVLNVTFNEV